MEGDILHGYQLERVISKEGEGYHNSMYVNARVYRVQLATRITDQEKVVIKYYTIINKADYDALSVKLITKEYEHLNRLRHPNVVAVYEHGREHIMTQGKPKCEVVFIVLEYLPGGSLFDLLQNTSLPEPLSAYIFRELLKATDFIHNQGYAHLDLKLENTMFDKEGRVKIIDMGFTTELKGMKGDGKLLSWVGTRTYMSPEICEHKPFPGFSADIFALGVMLFTLVARAFPFGQATSQDKLYSVISQENYDTYWKHMCVLSPTEHFSPPLQNLLNSLFAYTPVSRPTVPEILQHPWLASTPLLPDAEALKTLRGLCKLPP